VRALKFQPLEGCPAIGPRPAGEVDPVEAQEVEDHQGHRRTGGQGRSLRRAGHVEPLGQSRKRGYAVAQHHRFTVEQHVLEFVCQTC
jgi:hypothetical protein